MIPTVGRNADSVRDAAHLARYPLIFVLECRNGKRTIDDRFANEINLGKEQDKTFIHNLCTHFFFGHEQERTLIHTYEHILFFKRSLAMQPICIDTHMTHIHTYMTHIHTHGTEHTVVLVRTHTHTHTQRERERERVSHTHTHTHTHTLSLSLSLSITHTHTQTHTHTHTRSQDSATTTAREWNGAIQRHARRVRECTSPRGHSRSLDP